MPLLCAAPDGQCANGVVLQPPNPDQAHCFHPLRAHHKHGAVLVWVGVLGHGGLGRGHPLGQRLARVAVGLVGQRRLELCVVGGARIRVHQHLPGGERRVWSFEPPAARTAGRMGSRDGEEGPTMDSECQALHCADVCVPAPKHTENGAHLVRFIEQDADVVAGVAHEVWVALLARAAVRALDLLKRRIVVHLPGERRGGGVGSARAQHRRSQREARFAAMTSQTAPLHTRAKVPPQGACSLQRQRLLACRNCAAQQCIRAACCPVASRRQLLGVHNPRPWRATHPQQLVEVDKAASLKHEGACIHGHVRSVLAARH